MGDVTGDEPAQFDWAWLVPRVVHPIKVAIVEAMTWIGRPLSSAELAEVFEDQYPIGTIAYHVRTLRDSKVLTPVSHRHVRGAVETFYAFPQSI